MVMLQAKVRVWKVDGEVEKVLWNHLRPEQLLVRGGSTPGDGEMGKMTVLIFYILIFISLYIGKY